MPRSLPSSPHDVPHDAGPRRRRRRSTVLAVSALLSLGLVAVPGSSAVAVAELDEVVTWGASADRVTGSATDQTVRNVVHTSIGGPAARISLSNVFGDRALTFDAVYVGVQGDGAAVKPGTNTRVTFSGGHTSVTVPAGAEVLSDQARLAVPADANLAVSVHVVGASGALTGHNFTAQTSYLSAAGNFAADEAATAFGTSINRWYWVDAVVVDAPELVDTVAFLGDSITDGVGSTTNANHRYPDYLADRLATRPVVQRFGIMNEGISGNRVLADGAGVSAQARLDRDVLSQPDVKSVVLLEGINDIGGGQATSADQVISAYRQLIARAHSADVCIIGGTLTPFAGAFPGYYTPEKDQIRVAVNQFIRTSGEFDSVVDFDAATRDPQNPNRFLPAYDSGDHLHPSDAGYQAMADAVDLKQLNCRRSR